MGKKKPPQLPKVRRIEVFVKLKAASTIIWDTRGCGTSHQFTSGVCSEFWAQRCGFNTYTGRRNIWWWVYSGEQSILHCSVGYSVRIPLPKSESFRLHFTADRAALPAGRTVISNVISGICNIGNCKSNIPSSWEWTQLPRFAGLQPVLTGKLH